MKNCIAISDVSRHLAKVSHRIESLSNSVEMMRSAEPALASTYETLMLDELEHAQVLILNLTDLITNDSPDQTANTDEGSVFAAGELFAASNNVIEPEKHHDSKANPAKLVNPPKLPTKLS